MGMTIDHAIETLLDTRSYGAVTIAKSMAIETMRKYQKIQNIINNTEYIEEDVIRYKMICEVIENG